MVPLLSLPLISFLVLAAEGVEGKTNEAANQKGFLPSNPLPRQYLISLWIPLLTALFELLCRSSFFFFFFSPLCFRRTQRAIRFRHAERRRERAQIPQHLESEGELLPSLCFFYILNRTVDSNNVNGMKIFIFKCMKKIITSM